MWVWQMSYEMRLKLREHFMRFPSWGMQCMSLRSVPMNGSEAARCG